MNEAEFIFKIIIIGDTAVGKSSIMNRYTDNTFEDFSVSTIGLDFKIKGIELDGNKIKLQIWDTAGQERFRAMVSYYYRGANGIFLVFDLTQKSSFIHLKDWMNELKKKDALSMAEIRILGNKADLQDQIEVSDDEIDDFLTENKISRSKYFKISAKDNYKIEESFLNLTKDLLEKYKTCESKSPPKFMKPPVEPSKGCC